MIATVENPFFNGVQFASFNTYGGCETLGQTFVVDKAFSLDRISIYGEDELGYLNESEAIMLGLYDLGVAAGTPDDDSYTVDKNLLNNGKGLKVSYEVQAPGIIHYDLSKKNQVKLKAGHRYAWELKGKKGTLPIGWYVTRKHLFEGGKAYKDHSVIEQRNGETVDYAVAFYGTQSPKK
jgi:hypothetical protein